MTHSVNRVGLSNFPSTVRMPRGLMDIKLFLDLGVDGTYERAEEIAKVLLGDFVDVYGPASPGIWVASIKYQVRPT